LELASEKRQPIGADSDPAVNAAENASKIVDHLADSRTIALYHWAHVSLARANLARPISAIAILAKE
jgi:hypothetical protein